MRMSDWSSDVCSSYLKGTRLIELIHRAIPYPVVLITSDEGGLTLSAAHKRKAQNEAGRVVVEGVVAAAGLHLDGADAMQTAFLASLALAAQPRTDLHSLYSGRSEEHTSELQSLMRISYAVFCLKKKKINHQKQAY